MRAGYYFPWALAFSMYKSDTAKHYKAYQDMCRYYDDERPEEKNQHELLVQAEIELSRLKEQHDLEIQSYITVLNQKDAEREEALQKQREELVWKYSANTEKELKEQEEILRELPKEKKLGAYKECTNCNARFYTEKYEGYNQCLKDIKHKLGVE